MPAFLILIIGYALLLNEPAETDAAMIGGLRKTQADIAGMLVTRLTYDRDDLPPAAPNDQEDAFNVITQLVDFERHKLWRGDHLVYDGGHQRAAIAITDLRLQWRCHHLSPFDNVRYRIPFTQLSSFAREVGRPEFTGLTSPGHGTDEVLWGMTQALLPALDNPQQASQLFLEQLGLAVMIHLTQTYGGIHFPSRKKGTLAPWQERRATEFLVAHTSAAFSIAELASACDLSRSYFMKAFKETFGKTPYRWLLEYRVAKARDLLLSDHSIVDIASICGFADQSHLTRVFSDITGEPPGNWRRRNRSGQID